MFIEQKKLETFSHTLDGKELCKKTETYYLFENQQPNNKNTSVEIQNFYKKLFKLQEEKSLELGRPFSVFELLINLDNK